MKELLKGTLSEIVFFFYAHHIFSNPLKVMSVDETIDVMLNTQNSMIRFGDGEIVELIGRSLEFQKSSEQLTDDLRRLLHYPYDGVITTVLDAFDDVSEYRINSQHYWKIHMFSFRREYYKYCDCSRIYGNSCISRPYYIFIDKSRTSGWFDKIRRIWEGKNIVVVEGEATHNGVGNDLLDAAMKIERIICPAKDAYGVIEDIKEKCFSFEKSKMFLVSLGPAAKPLVEALYLAGYRALDIGNMDMEYEWFLMRASEKTVLPKHNVIGEEANRRAGYTDYLAQIKYRIGI